jgi:tRNA (mo5U34)-methyltransferase
MMSVASAEDSRAALAGHRRWYHTLELPGGVITPGQIDLRRVARRLLPSDLRGQRALDVGTFDGFWAFELERRGAEVVAIDVGAVSEIQVAPNQRAGVQAQAGEAGFQFGEGFRIARELLGSSVTPVVCDVLDLTPEAIGGPVDLAFMGALLVHLRDPVRALERIRGALRPGGLLYQLELVSLRHSLLHPRTPMGQLQTLHTPFNWWQPNAAALGAYLTTAGFVDVRGGGLHRPPQVRPMTGWYRGLRSRRPAWPVA